MSQSCHSLGCADLHAEVTGGLLDAGLAKGADLICQADLPGALSALLGGQGVLSAAISQGALSASLGDRARLTASVVDQAVLSASVVCEIGERPYLEIDPTYLWVIPDIEVSNDVLSNTFWRLS